MYFLIKSRKTQVCSVKEVQNIYSIIVKKKTCLGILDREDTWQRQ